LPPWFQLQLQNRLLIKIHIRARFDVCDIRWLSPLHTTAFVVEIGLPKTPHINIKTINNSINKP
jgi:hypothetical protein